MITICLYQEVKEHLRQHFDQGMVGSKFYGESPKAVLEEAIRHFPDTFYQAHVDDDGRVRLTLNFDKPIGQSRVVAINDLTVEERANMENRTRDDGKIVRVVHSSRMFPTALCQIVLAPNKEKHCPDKPYYDLITMFPGELAPPLPDSLEVSDAYWDSHVFVEP